ncbi:hypothetical protein C8J57DRAFT_1239613 [Mycena rebaudengoi]|nr:hypothetical protein C8J57DRAFT_1239613 [Mycena rebaudengoi]
MVVLRAAAGGKGASGGADDSGCEESPPEGTAKRATGAEPTLPPRAKAHPVGDAPEARADFPLKRWSVGCLERKHKQWDSGNPSVASTEDENWVLSQSACKITKALAACKKKREGGGAGGAWRHTRAKIIIEDASQVAMARRGESQEEALINSGNRSVKSRKLRTAATANVRAAMSLSRSRTARKRVLKGGCSGFGKGKKAWIALTEQGYTHAKDDCGRAGGDARMSADERDIGNRHATDGEGAMCERSKGSDVRSGKGTTACYERTDDSTSCVNKQSSRRLRTSGSDGSRLHSVGARIISERVRGFPGGRVVSKSASYKWKIMDKCVKHYGVRLYEQQAAENQKPRDGTKKRNQELSREAQDVPITPTGDWHQTQTNMGIQPLHLRLQPAQLFVRSHERADTAYTVLRRAKQVAKDQRSRGVKGRGERDIDFCSTESKNRSYFPDKYGGKDQKMGETREIWRRAVETSKHERYGASTASKIGASTAGKGPEAPHRYESTGSGGGWRATRRPAGTRSAVRWSTWHKCRTSRAKNPVVSMKRERRRGRPPARTKKGPGGLRGSRYLETQGQPERGARQLAASSPGAGAVRVRAGGQKRGVPWAKESETQGLSGWAASGNASATCKGGASAVCKGCKGVGGQEGTKVHTHATSSEGVNGPCMLQVYPKGLAMGVATAIRHEISVCREGLPTSPMHEAATKKEERGQGSAIGVSTRVRTCRAARVKASKSQRNATRCCDERDPELAVETSVQPVASAKGLRRKALGTSMEAGANDAENTNRRYSYAGGGGGRYRHQKGPINSQPELACSAQRVRRRMVTLRSSACLTVRVHGSRQSRESGWLMKRAGRNEGKEKEKEKRKEQGIHTLERRQKTRGCEPRSCILRETKCSIEENVEAHEGERVGLPPVAVTATAVESTAT